MQSFASLAKRQKVAPDPNHQNLQTLLSRYNSAVELFSQGKLSDSLVEFEAILSSEALTPPTEAPPSPLSLTLHISSLKYSAEIYEQLGDAKKSIESFIKAIVLNPDDVVTCYDLAKMAWRAKNIPLCRNILETSVHADGTFWPAWAMLVEVLYYIGDLRACEIAVGKARMVQPHNKRLQELALLCGERVMGGADSLPAFLTLPKDSDEEEEEAGVVPVGEIEAASPRQDARKRRKKSISPAPRKAGLSVITVTAFQWGSILKKLKAALKTSQINPILIKVNVNTPSSPRANSNSSDSLRGDLAAALSSVVQPSSEAAVNTVNVNAEQAKVEEWVRSIPSTELDIAAFTHMLLHALFESNYVITSKTMFTCLWRVAECINSWKGSGQDYFLSLAEAVFCVSDSSAAKQAMKLLDSYCFDNAHVLTSAGSEVIRVEYLKALNAIRKQSSSGLTHLTTCMNMLESYRSEIQLPHANKTLNKKVCEDMLGSLKHVQLAGDAKELHRQGEHLKVVEILIPLVLDPSKGCQFKVKRRVELLKLLSKNLLLIPNSQTEEQQKLQVKCLSALLKASVLMGAEKGKALDSTLIRGTMASISRYNDQLLSPSDFDDLKVVLKDVLVAASSKEITTGAMAFIAIEAFNLLSTMLDHDIRLITLIQKVHEALSNDSLCRVDGGAFLRRILVLEKQLRSEYTKEKPKPKSASTDGNNEQDETAGALRALDNIRNQALTCLFGARFVKKGDEGGHVCRIKAFHLNNQEIMAEAFSEIEEAVLKVIEDGSSMAGILGFIRKIHAQFSELPVEAFPRKMNVEKILLGEKVHGVRHWSPVPDACLGSYRHVYEQIFYISACLNIKYVYPISNRSSSTASTVIKSWMNKTAESIHDWLVIDLAFTPSRGESWRLLGKLNRSRCDHLLLHENKYLIDLEHEEREVLGRLRRTSINSFNQTLRCKLATTNAPQRIEDITELALQLLAVYRYATDKESAKPILVSALELLEKCGLPNRQESWVFYYVKGKLQRKLRKPAADYLDNFCRALLLCKKTQSGCAPRYKLHSLRLKLVMEDNPDLSTLSKYVANHKTATAPIAGKTPEELKKNIIEDAIAGLKKCREKISDFHKGDLAICDFFYLHPDYQFADALPYLSKLIPPQQDKASRFSISAPFVKVNVNQLDKYGLPLVEITDMECRKSLRVYLSWMKMDGGIDMLLNIFKALFQQCAAMLGCNMSHRAFLDELDTAATLLYDSVDGNLNFEKDKEEYKKLLCAAYVLSERLKCSSAGLLDNVKENITQEEIRSTVKKAYLKYTGEKANSKPKWDVVYKTCRKLVGELCHVAAPSAADIAKITESPDYTAHFQPKSKVPEDAEGGTSTTARRRSSTMKSYGFDIENPKYPLVITPSLTILDFGKIEWKRSAFHSKRYIYPLGFKSQREFNSPSKKEDRCLWISEIGLDEASGAPKFTVTCADDPSFTFSGAAASSAWSEVVTLLKSKGFMGAHSSHSGPERFGLTHPYVAHIISKLPDADKCTKYEGRAKKT